MYFPHSVATCFAEKLCFFFGAILIIHVFASYQPIELEPTRTLPIIPTVMELHQEVGRQLPELRKQQERELGRF